MMEDESNDVLSEANVEDDKHVSNMNILQIKLVKHDLETI
jgi:hypothetical protein